MDQHASIPRMSVSISHKTLTRPFRVPGSVLVAETGTRTRITKPPLASAPSGFHQLHGLSVMLHVRPDNEVTGVYCF